MARFLFDCLDGLRPQIAGSSRYFLFLDFDGTLAPIVISPDRAELPAETRGVLCALANDPAFLVALVSGRSITDLRLRSAFHCAAEHKIVFAGNHGLEIQGCGIDFMEPLARERAAALQALLAEVREPLLTIRGVELEDKGLSASIHFRKAPEARDEVFRILTPRIDNDVFRVRAGKMVAEILPRAGGNEAGEGHTPGKGAALRYIRSSLTQPGSSAGDLTICAGDDATDEDLFEAADGGISIKVGEQGPTSAAYFVRSTEQMREFLIWLGTQAHGK